MSEKLPTIHDIHPTTVRPKKGVFGIEVEVEFKEGGGVQAPPGWKTHIEQSLRNGIEYVSSQPVSADLMPTRVDDLYAKLNEKPVVDWNSIRTSIHTHINVAEETVLDVYKYITSYFLLENIILNYVDKRRRGNLFCLDINCAEDLAQKLRSDISKKECFAFVRDSTSIRYASLNLSAITKFNSVEFRALQGSATKEQVIEWSEMLYTLLQNSKKYKTPSEIVDRYFSSSPTSFVESLLPTPFIRKIAIGAWVNQIEDNLGIVANFAYATDWSRWAKVVSGRGNGGKGFKEAMPQQGLDVDDVLDQVASGQSQPASLYPTAPPHWAALEALTNEDILND